MAQVKLTNVRKVFPGNVLAVDDFSQTIADGEFVVLVGPSGCGKSTTLRMVAGLEEVTAGTIEIGGHVVNDVHPKDRDIAMVFQNYALYPHMTVYKNLAFALKLRRTPRDEIDRRVRKAASILGIEELLSRKPRALSGGQRQRVAVGRAIVREPKAFLFDEPLSNLDAKLRVTTRAELKALHLRLKTTTIYVTHDQEEAMTLGDRVVVMNAGRIQQADTPLTVYNKPVNRFVASFIGTPPMNFLDGCVVREGDELWFIEGSDDPDGRPYRIRVDARHTDRVAGYAGSPLVMGLRPQALRESDSPVPGQTLKLRVSVVEPLGDQMDVFLSTPKHDAIVARVKARTGLPVEKPALFTIDHDAVHYFEPGEFGRNILMAGEHAIA